MFPKLLNKTLDAAKKSALQLYEDDYPFIQEIGSRDNQSKKREQNGSHESGHKHHSDIGKQTTTDENTPGVRFERSTPLNGESRKSDNASNGLQSLRAYAAEQEQKKEESSGNWKQNKDSVLAGSFPAEKTKESIEDKSVHDTEHQQGNNTKLSYSRKDVRKQTKNKTSPVSDSSNLNRDTNGEPHNKSGKQSISSHSNNAVKTAKNNSAEDSKQSQPPAKSDKTELETRIEHVESLLQLQLNSSEYRHATHPIFYKLQRKGVSKYLIERWFQQITSQGVDPDRQFELFLLKITELIENHLRVAEAKKQKQMMLFCGRSGSGKTRLIMKLMQHPLFMNNRSVAVASLQPSGSYYSILEPFCSDMDYLFIPIKGSSDIEKIRKRRKEYDHILIDTPSLDIDDSNNIDQINDLKKGLEESPLETHYLVNTASSGVAYNDPLAGEIEADHVALSHIDQSSRWGETAQLISTTDYSLRYVSSGPKGVDQLIPFDPEKFAAKLLR